MIPIQKSMAIHTHPVVTSHLGHARLHALNAKDKEATKVDGHPVEKEENKAGGSVFQVLGRVLCLVDVRQL
jgi:hypothetical protein